MPILRLAESFKIMNRAGPTHKDPTRPGVVGYNGIIYKSQLYFKFYKYSFINKNEFLGEKKQFSFFLDFFFLIISKVQ